MKARNKIYRWLLTIGLIIGSAAALYLHAQATLPTYQFRSTSAYTMTMNTTVYEPGLESPSYTAKAPRKTSIWDEEPDGDEIAVVDTPVGEPLILLAFILLYLIYKIFSFSCIYQKKSSNLFLLFVSMLASIGMHAETTQVR